MRQQEYKTLRLSLTSYGGTQDINSTKAECHRGSFWKCVTQIFRNCQESRKLLPHRQVSPPSTRPPEPLTLARWLLPVWVRDEAGRASAGHQGLNEGWISDPHRQGWLSTAQQEARSFNLNTTQSQDKPQNLELFLQFLPENTTFKCTRW